MVAVALETDNPSHHRTPSSRSLAPGTELLGQYEASAFTQPRYLLRRSDGQVIQVTRLLYLVAAGLEGDHGLVDIAADLSAALDRPVSVDNVNYLIDNKLEPLGVLAADGADSPLTRSNPLLLGLRFRTRVVPERIHRGVSRALRPLFWPPLVLAVLIAFAGLDIWLAATQTSTILKGVQQTLLQPDLLLAVIAISIAVGFFHEIGHATAARYGGAKPGVMGVGIYLMLPVFYTDVTDSYRLDRRGRLRTDLGGLYFNTIAVLVTAGLYQATHFSVLLVFAGISQLEMIYQFFPFVRMDGYYVVSDLIGVPNLFAYVGPTINRLARRQDRAGRDRLQALKPRARHAITGWVALTVPILALNAALLVFFAPRIFPTMWTSARTQARGLTHAVSAGNAIGALNHLSELVLVAVPAAGIGFFGAQLLRRRGLVAGRRIVVWLRRTVQQLNERTRRRVISVFAVALVVSAVIAGGVVFSDHAVSGSSPHDTTAAAAGPGAIHVPSPKSPTSAPPSVTPAPARPVALTSTGGSTIAATPDGHGYWLAAPDGKVTGFGDAGLYGSTAGWHLNQPVVGIAATPDGHGYWLVAADGGVFAFGDAGFYGSTAGWHLNQPVVGMAATPDGHGYWLVAADGGVFAFGDAGFHGSESSARLNQPVVGMAPTPDGHGYWLVAADGGVFSFGDATFHGSTARWHLNQPVVGMAATPDGHGYWLVAADGGVFAFGHAVFHGSDANVAHAAPVIGIMANNHPSGPAHSGVGYRLLEADGGLLPPPGGR